MRDKPYVAKFCAAGLLLGATACSTPTPDFCKSDLDCSVARPFCDVNGIYEASGFTGRTCIPNPLDAAVADIDATGSGTPDATRPDSAVADARRPDGAPNSPDAGVPDAFIPDAEPPNLVLNPTEYDFGNIEISPQSVPSITFELINSGLDPFESSAIVLNITGPSTGPFAASSVDCGGQLAPRGGRCTLVVRFNPNSSGLFEEDLQVLNMPAGTVVYASAKLTGAGVIVPDAGIADAAVLPDAPP